jgi:hypothetical protein
MDKPSESYDQAAWDDYLRQLDITMKLAFLEKELMSWRDYKRIVHRAAHNEHLGADDE